MPPNPLAAEDEDEAEVPYGENFHVERVARAWADAAILKRPWRLKFFDRFAAAVSASDAPSPRVLELGSGPGFLAEHVLDRCPSIARYSLLDFSSPMLALSRQRLRRHAAQTRFIRSDFRSHRWFEDARGPFDLVLSMQAVHELRHKRHARQLYGQVRSVLSHTADVLVCDHVPGYASTPSQRALYMTISENLDAFAAAGFPRLEVLWVAHDMALYRART